MSAMITDEAASLHATTIQTATATLAKAIHAARADGLRVDVRVEHVNVAALDQRMTTFTDIYVSVLKEVRL